TLTSRRGRDRCRSRCWCSSSCGCRRRCWGWSWIRRGGRCRCPRWHLKGIYFVIGTEVDSTADNDTGVPLARAAHYFVRPATGENDCACVTFVAIQLTIPLHVGYPNNRIACSVSRRHPGGTSPALTDVPG